MAIYNLKLTGLCSGGGHGTLSVSNGANFSGKIETARYVQIRAALASMEPLDLAMTLAALYAQINNVTDQQVVSALTSQSGANIELRVAP